MRVGDTITDTKRPAGEALPGFKVVQPMVFTGLFPTEATSSRSCATRSRSSS